MDDMGSSHAANAAGINLFKKGIVTSCSVMVPCAYAYDFIRWWKQHPQYDTGIHFTLTCEWDNGKWAPIGGYETTKTLWNPDYFMWQTNETPVKNADPTDVYNELEAQIQRALHWGLVPTHFDRHMHTVMLNDGFYRAYTSLSQKYKVPFQITKNEVKPGDNAVKHTTPIDYLIGIGGGPGLNKKQKTECLRETLAGLKPGITQLTLHPVMDTPEIQYIIPDGYERVNEYEIFMSDDTMEYIKNNQIKLINYKTIQNILF